MRGPDRRLATGRPPPGPCARPETSRDPDVGTHEPPPDLAATRVPGLPADPGVSMHHRRPTRRGHRFLVRAQGHDEPCLAERRSHELVYLALAADGRIGGLTSVSLGRRDTDGRNCL